MSSSHPLRRQLFVDKQVQGVLLARVILYWAFCLVTVTLVLLTWQIATGPAQDVHVHLKHLWLHYAPVAVASFVLLPILLLDTLQLSNRFAGPMVRLRQGLTHLADGRVDLPPLHFRRGDFWHEFAHEYNRIVQRMQQYQSPPSLSDPDLWPEIEPEETQDTQDQDIEATPPAPAELEAVGK